MAAWLWKEWDDRLKIFLAAWIESVVTMILEIPAELVAWLIPHLMVNNSASVIITFTAWWRVLIRGLLWMWIWEIEIAILFLMLASVIMRAWKGLLKDSIAMWSSCWTLDLRLSSHVPLLFFFLNQQFITWHMEIDWSCASFFIFIFFLYQQFITRHVVVDCGSDYIATYMHSKLTLRYKEEEREKESEREKQKSNENRK